MGIVTMDAEQVRPLAPVEIARPLSVYPCLPVPVYISVALAAEQVAFSKIDKLAVYEPQLVPVCRIMTVKAPPHAFGMMERDICVLFLQHPPCRIGLQARVAGAARKNAF